MANPIHINDLHSHPFIKAVCDAFSHLDIVKRMLAHNDFSPMLQGYSLAEFEKGNISFEEYFVRNLLKKVDNVIVDGVDPDALTEAKFTSFLSNQEKDVHRVRALLDVVDETTSVGRVLQRARKRFHEVVDDFSEQRIHPRFTSGASLTLTKIQGVSPFNRYRASEGSDYLLAQFNLRREKWHKGEAGGYLRTSFLETRFPQVYNTKAGNYFYVELSMVPKLWNGRRIIGKTGTSVLAVQSGLGDYLVARARTCLGINISTAQETHKRVARMASLTLRHLMTADQSEASDRILRILVQWLSTENFFDFLTDISPSTIRLFDGSSVSTHMMAPAGNGYIFPLQTILFYVLAEAVCQECGVKPEIYSYGDDLIAPAAVYSQLNKVFEALSLKLNLEKTFSSTTARESCGGDYVLGSDVRPLYVNTIPSSTSEWYSIINGVRRVCYDNNLGNWRTNNFKRLWLWCIKHLSPKHRLFAPTHYGDTAIASPDDRLYRLSYKRQYVCTDKTVRRYPNGGIGPGGHPYSGWYITINVTKSSGKGETWAEHTKGIKSIDLIRLTSLDSVKGSGGYSRAFNRDRDGKVLPKPIMKIVQPHFFNKDEYLIRQEQVPYFMGSPAPHDDLNDLFSVLAEDNPIRDSSGVIERGVERHAQCITSLIGLLRTRVDFITAQSDKVKCLELNF